MFSKILVVAVAVAALATSAQVRVTPPLPYASSPPPSPVDTTPLDPGRKPTCQTVVDLEDAWYADWDLVQARGLTEPMPGPRKGAVNFHATFDSRGWLTELVHLDEKGKERWTQMFSYPAHIPAGPGVVDYTYTFVNPRGEIIDLREIKERFGRFEFGPKVDRLKVRDAIGEPLVIRTLPDGGQVWSYFEGENLKNIDFDSKGKFVVRTAPPPPAVVPAASPAPIPATAP